MMAEGMMKEGSRDAKGVYNGVYERLATVPNAGAWGLDEGTNGVQPMYMRPGAIWSMEIVNEVRASKAHAPSPMDNNKILVARFKMFPYKVSACLI